jgi:succinate dehydrogenase / fumarate reductase iron-sulfur subunit
VRKLTVRIKRYRPEREDAPHWETYRVEADPIDRVLDVLLRVKWEQDDTLALRYTCAHGICGSDAMRIHGFHSLSCKTLSTPLPQLQRLSSTTLK